MNYKEFKNTYSFMVKKYPDITSIYGVEINATCIIENYVKSGKKWILSDTKQDNNISSEYYFNVVNAIPFFRNLGGKELISCKYTKYGYIPYQINSINPDKTKKTIRTFIFK